MPLVLADRVNETTTTTSTGTITLAGAVSGYQSFAVIGNGNTTYYTIVHQTANEWEVGIGTYTSSGTLLSRDTVLASSNSGSLVNFSAGTKFVFCDYPAGRAVYLDTATNVTIPGLTLSGGTANGVLYLNGSKVATSGSALTFNGTTLVSPDITDSSLTSGRVTYAGTGGNFVDSANLTFNGTTLVAADFTDSSLTSGRVVFSGAGGNLSDSSSLTWNGTGLGIGVSSASSLLDIAGATPLLIVNQSSGTSTKLSIRETGSEYAYIDSSTSTKQLRLSIGPNAPWGGIISFVTNTSERARISAAGNLLLGTTTVAYANTLLNIGSTSDTENGVQITTSTTGSGYILFGDGSAGAAYVGQVKYTHTDNAMSFWTNGTIKTTLTSAGNFGIGTTNPTNTAGFSRQVQIDGTTSCLTLNGTTGSGKYSLGVPGANAVGLWDNTASAYRWYVDSSGNLGIGTTSPEALLHLNKATVGGEGAFIFLDNPAASTLGNKTGIRFATNSGATFSNYGSFIEAINTNAGNGAEALTFGTWNGTARAERVRITADGNLGVGTATPGARLQVKSIADAFRIEGTAARGSGNIFASFHDPSGRKGYWGYGDPADNFYIANEMNAAMIFSTNTVERVRITAAGDVGIGTTIPSFYSGRLTVDGGNIALASAGRSLFWNAGGTGVAAIQGVGTDALAFQTSNSYTEQMRLASAGLGLGIAPRAWAGGYKSLDIVGPGAIASTASGDTFTQVANGAWFDGANWIYQYTGVGAARYQMTGPSGGGSHAWFVAPTGTASGTVSFTQAMTLNASGNLLVGTTSAGNARFVVRGPGTTSATASLEGATSGGATRFLVSDDGLCRWYGTSNAETMRLDNAGNLGIGITSPSTYGGLVLVRSQNSDARVWVRNEDAGSSSRASYVVNAAGNSWSMGMGSTANNGNALTWVLDVGGGNTEHMRLDTSGRLGIGTTSNALTHPLTLYASGSTSRYMAVGNSNTGLNGTVFGIDGSGNTAINNTQNLAMLFLTNNTERARIDSSGRVIINGTTQLYTSTLTLYRTGNSYNLTSTLTGTGNEGHVVFENGNGAVGTIFTNGTATAYNTSSDYRLKNTIAPMTGALAKVALLKPCTYKWNADGSDGQGFIAHELAEVVPQCVTGEKDAVDAEGKPRYQGVDTSFLVATLTAAIQELTARVAQLENK